MKRINTERQKLDPENQKRLIYDGQRTAQEIFAELRYRLEAGDYLPDEYFMLDSSWVNGREWPESGDIFCTVDYGGSEGIYVDIYMKYLDKNKQWHTENFATGKTLGESNADMDRMFLIASAVTKAFHSNEPHARYVQVGDGKVEVQGEAIFHLNPDEKKILTDSLIETRLQWQRENKPFEIIEQLLRRIIGSITEYIKMVGEKPQTMSDYDVAALAVADGDMDAFNAVISDIPHTYGSLLKQAAARPDRVGLEMTAFLCGKTENLDNDTYMQACKNAIDTNDIEKTLLLMKKAPDCVPDLKDSFHGDVLLHALYSDEKHGGKKTQLAAELAEQCTTKQISAADPFLLKLAIMSENRRLTDTLLNKRISVASEPAMLIYAAAQKKDIYLAEKLIAAGADINGQKYAALQACMNINDQATGIFLLNLGADFQGFKNSVMGKGADKRPLSEQKIGFLFAMKSYWENNLEPYTEEEEQFCDDEDEWEQEF